MTIDTQRLRELAQKATYTGGWYYAGCNTVHCDYSNDDGYQHDEVAHPVPLGCAEFIAAANPAVVLALLDEIDRLRAIEAAARNLAKVKGRYNSEIAMNQLLEALK